MVNIDANIIADMRRFNRFYTNLLGVLDRHVLDSGYSFTEARVIIEIGLIEPCIANTLVESLKIDRSYMSRIIAKFCKEGFLVKENSTLDNRTNLIRLTPKGKTFYNQLNERSDEQILRLVQGLSEEEIQQLHASMLLIQKKLDISERIQNDTI
ncbi:MarR family winged helix-turn-helix transcriptional regulator [Paenibacillus ottowii]|uniref:Winged helix-turn-helix transcriptional regulator n=1 Tax=Paenibacillus ottowii TaxID=2315729 RepID=A0ABY3B4L0_9BACL|nr:MULTISPECIES: MarR family winged helix-turn-helix transcriptional regulator [Paenibacillus]KZE67363.1 transcriptional regulator [Paenibacillus jamilae]MDP1511826.1 MarR family winged helix-turn-helix transcriptional regulator [Paenibacillus ottowii]NEU25830.1 winged helix-turn-helix transcriptional regulator [Paenibacillus polymyxa]OBA03935.1 transcriptional regulator [Paenibacillus polymyxa]QDY84247.1 winged helix-turn-helix transcriptional regulator [Paenibacillus polymyxa]